MGMKTPTTIRTTRENENSRIGFAEIVPGNSIRLFGARKAHGAHGPAVCKLHADCLACPAVGAACANESGCGMHHGYDLTYVVGESAEYDSYNFSYFGKIVSITEKSVTIQPEASRRARRLKIEQFDWRNQNPESRTSFSDWAQAS
jgi:hypothetical protein